MLPSRFVFALLMFDVSAIRLPPLPTSRRDFVGSACLAGAVLPAGAANAAEKKPMVKDIVAQLDKSTPKEERNVGSDELKAEFFPKISFEGSQGQGRKIVYTLPHENLSPPSFSSVEFMWIKEEATGSILTAKKFPPSDPNLVITAFGSSGQVLTAACKDSKNGIWQGTFKVP